MHVNVSTEVWPHVWVRSANMFGEVVQVYEDGTALVEFDEIMAHEIGTGRGYGYAADVELYDVYRFHMVQQ